MELTLGADHLWPWAPIPIGLGVGFLLAWWATGRRSRTPGDLLVAGTARLRTLPRFQQLARRRRWSGLLLAGTALLVVAGTAMVLTRPQVTDVREGDRRARDIMVCLDASASMDEYNLAVVQELRQIVDDLGDDRLGIMVWSGAAVVVVPLTDDDGYLRAGLDRAEESFRTGRGSLFDGVDLPNDRSSLIGDGVVSCVDRLTEEKRRTRAVLLSSDNDPVGKPVYELLAAADHAADEDVVVYALGAPSLSNDGRTAARVELEEAAARTGGVLALVGSDGSTDQLVDRIDALEASRGAVPPSKVSSDAPGLGLVLCAAGGVLLALMWGGVLVRRAAGRRP